MSDTLSEDEMRAALFGTTAPSAAESFSQRQSTPSSSPALKPSSSRRLTSRLRVTLRVTKIFEGPEEMFVHDANTLSSLVAEGEAKAAARKMKFRYFELLSIEPVQV